MSPPRVSKDGRTRTQNAHTQPLIEHRVFNNPQVLTEGWYPVCRGRSLKRGQARSFLIAFQRIVLFRGADGVVHALDAFCPHMGADLGNGRVVGTELQCYFHRWQFDGAGSLSRLPEGCPKPTQGPRLASYPVEERYGHLWVFAAPGEKAPYPVPTCPGLEEVEVAAWALGETTLFAHHHVMMAGGIDLQHFAAVHGLEVDFELQVAQRHDDVADWNLSGALKGAGWRYRVGRMILGPQAGYAVRFGGGTVAGITYGPDQRLRGKGLRLPSMHLLWGCVPLESGVSRVAIFVLTRKRPGALGAVTNALLFLLTLVLLAILKDDDVKAFPNMRFNPAALTAADRSVGRFIGFINSLPVSQWSRRLEQGSRPVQVNQKP